MKQHIGLVLGLLTVLVTVIVSLVLLASPPKPQPTSSEPMRIGTYYWPGMYWIDIARSKGWFKEAGLNVTFVDTNPDYYGAVTDVQEGDLDTLAIWLFDLMQMYEDGSDLAMVVATDESDGSEALVGSADIASVSQLEGKRIGVPEGTALVYALDAMLARYGLTMEDVSLVNIDPEKAATKLAAGDVDAVMTWEPYASAAAVNGHRLYDTSMVQGLITAGMVFRREFIEGRPEDIHAMLKVWHRATQYIHAEPETAFAIVAEAQGVSAEEVADFAELNHILGLRENVTAFTYASGLESLFGSARKIQRFLLKTNGEDTLLKPPDSILSGRFVRELARQESGH